MLSLPLDYRRLVDRAPAPVPAAIARSPTCCCSGPRIAGTRRWFVLGPVQVQPSEFAKLVAALLVAKMFAESKKESLGLLDIAGARASPSACWRC